MDAGREFIKGMVQGKLLSESVDVRYCLYFFKCIHQCEASDAL